MAQVEAPADLRYVDADADKADPAGGLSSSDPCSADKALEPWNIKDDDARWEKITDDGGLMKLIVKKSEDEVADLTKPISGDKVKCHYSGFLKDGGKMFDSSRSRGEFFEFEIGKGRVIKGWDEGIATMEAGEKAILRCRSDYAYGDNGSPPNIPGGATLDFVVELDSTSEGFESIWDIEDAQGTITKKEVKKPEGWETAKESAKVKVTLTARLKNKKGKVFLEEKEKELEIPYDLEFEHKGISAEYPYPRGFYNCMRNCGKSGVFHFKLENSAAYTYGSTGCEKLGVPPGANLHLEITMHEMNNPKNAWSVEKDEKIPFAKELKDKATVYFRKKKLEVAKKLYKDCVDAMKSVDNDGTDEQKKEKATLEVACLSNTALIETQLGNNEEALKAVEEGLKIDSKHIKLRYRKAQIEFKRTNFSEAIKLADALLVDAPDNKGAIALRAKSKQAMKAAEKKKRALAKKMFKGFGKKAKKEPKKEEEKKAEEKEATKEE